MTDLRETLATRMRKLWIEDNLQRGGWDLVVADECIRQMRWTLAMTTEAYMLAAGPPNDVTAAPDDWSVPHE